MRQSAPPVELDIDLDDLDWEYLRGNSFRSQTFKLLYIATPKVACTSFKWWFAALEGCTQMVESSIDSAETDPNLIIHDTFHKVAPTVTGLKPAELLEPLTSESYFRFAVVRNPYKRIFSAWQSKLLLREPLQIGPYLNTSFFHRDIGSIRDIALAFEGFLDYLRSHEWPNINDPHWRPQTEVLMVDKIAYSIIAKIESLDALWKLLADRINPSIFFKPEKDLNKSLIPFSSRFFTAHSIEIIKELYASDFDYFNYSHDLPDAGEKFTESQANIAIRAISMVRGRNQRISQIWKLFGELSAASDRKASSLSAENCRLQQMVAGSEERIAHLNQAIASRDNTIANKDAQILNLTHVLSCGELRNSNLEKSLDDINKQKQILSGELTELRKLFKRRIADRDRQLSDRDRQLSDRDRQLNAIYTSSSWRLTSPLRFLKRILGSSVVRSRQLIARTSHIIYRTTPIPIEGKIRIKSFLFSRFSPLFRHTAAYRNWLEFHRSGAKITLAKREADKVQRPPAVGGTIEQPIRVTAISFAEEYLPNLDSSPLATPPVRLIAFYLPQFHPIPENDEWWGKGFTEWTNVTRAMPQFVGHYQPHLPAELGFYDLRMVEVQRRQVELAKLAGVFGFCFYFYWFAGKRMLDAPLEQYLAHSELDLPFCLCWANENWSRRWDGLDQEVLIAQNHSPEDDLAFIEHVARYLRDPRYIRINGRPLLLVYVPSKLPSASETAQRWRGYCRREGIGELYLAYTQSFDRTDPYLLGFDAAIEFPPNNISAPIYKGELTWLNPNFEGTVYDWRHFVETSRNYRPPDYKLFRGVCPSWDNEARRPGRGAIYVHSSPDGYEEWLANAAHDTVQRFSRPDERLVFVNAWNEWAEGAHLEPDMHYGYAYLQATRNALSRPFQEYTGRRIVLVSHDAYPHGAQFLALNLARTLSRDFGYRVALILLGEGPLREQYGRFAEVHNLAGLDPNGSEAKMLAQQLSSEGYSSAICNTTVSGLFLQTLSEAGFHTVALIHELPGVIRDHRLQTNAVAIANFANKVVFPSAVVESGFREFADVAPSKRILRAQGLYKRNIYRSPEEVSRARSMLRDQLGIEQNARIVLGVGYADLRKGIDLFVGAGIALIKESPLTAMVWLGHWDTRIEPELKAKVESSGVAHRFFFPGLCEETNIYYAGADVFALTSREDPFPSVVLEAIDSSLPVVAFEGAGGFEYLLKSGCGALAPEGDLPSYQALLAELLEDRDLAVSIGHIGRQKIEDEFSFRDYLFDLLEMAGQAFRKVSTIIPNYNYAQYLEQRLASIIEQTYPVYELIILDDASSDDSLKVIRHFIDRNTHIPIRLIESNTNSGSVFNQWIKGARQARGDYLWIAEADDFCAHKFLEHVIHGFDDLGVVLSYCQSHQIDEDGNLLCGHYLDYTSEIDAEKWTHDYVCDGVEEINRALAIKNTIPNVSAVVFVKDKLDDVLKNNHSRIMKYKVAGDWLVYTDILQHGSICYSAEPLNFHRRHKRSVTLDSQCERHIAEIIAIQNNVREKISISAETEQKAGEYIDKLYRQFELHNSGFDNALVHPEIKQALSEIMEHKIANDKLSV